MIIFVSCCSVPQNKKNYHKEKLVVMSPLTKKFLEDFEKEYNSFNKNENFVPSEDLKNNYLISFRDNGYLISGLIKVDEFFNQADFPGLLINTRAGNILTVNIPLNLFFDIIVNENIKYLQIDEKVSRKNKE